MYIRVPLKHTYKDSGFRGLGARAGLGLKGLGMELVWIQVLGLAFRV